MSYVDFILKERKTKTLVYSVVSRSGKEVLGEVKWYGPWRQYCFTPTLEGETVWSRGCLTEICDFMDKIMFSRALGLKTKSLEAFTG